MTTRPFEGGSVLEVCPMLVLGAADVEAVCRTPLGPYAFAWPDGGAALALGWGSLYNHSAIPNAAYQRHGEATLVVHALRRLDTGDEVLLDYSGGGTHPLHFDPR